MPMCRCDYVAFRDIALFSWYGLSAVWDSLGVGTCQDMFIVHSLAYIQENILNSHLDVSASNLDYVPKTFKRSR